MRILLIDDEASRGWKEVLECVLFDGAEIGVAEDLDQAMTLLKNEEFDLIFLDLRFGESDHTKKSVLKFGGYKLLTEVIRSSFYQKNFATPVILFTASNKIWYIDEMIEKGADDYYIKEHPDTYYDLEFSWDNYTRLKNSVKRLDKLGMRRREVWDRIVEITKALPNHIVSKNIRCRIEEKLRIGYGVLFGRSRMVEKELLLFNSEILSFVIFWSILEEISHDYYERKTGKEIEWRLRKNKYSLQSLIESGKAVETYFETIRQSTNDSRVIENKGPLFKIELSKQICGILRYQLGWDFGLVENKFLRNLNLYRNKIDFIHSSTDSILNKKLADNQESEEGYLKCIEILDFIKNLVPAR